MRLRSLLQPLRQYLNRGRSMQRLEQPRRRLFLECLEERTLLSNWRPVGPDNVAASYTRSTVSGRVDAIAVSPNFDGHGTPAMFLGTVGGVWRSTNFASPAPTWTPLTDNVADQLGVPPEQQLGILGVDALVIDPNHPNIVYAGTGDFLSGVNGAGILKSVDGGNSWNLLGQSTFGRQSGIRKLVVDPTDASGNTVYASNSQGIYKSTDGGATWTSRVNGLPASVGADDLEYTLTQPSPSDPVTLTLYAGISADPAATRGIWRLNPTGDDTWHQMDIHLVDHATGRDVGPERVGRIQLAASHAISAYPLAFAVVADTTSNAALNVFILTVGSTTWRPVNQFPGTNTQRGYALSIGLDPYSFSVFVGTNNFYRSGDLGTWPDIQTGRNGVRIHDDSHAWAFYGGQVYAGNDGGVWRYNPLPGTIQGLDSGCWQSLNTAGLQTILTTGASQHPTNPNVLRAEAQDNGDMLRSSAGAWAYTSGNDGGKIQYDPDPNGGGRYAYFLDVDSHFYRLDSAGTSFDRDIGANLPGSPRIPFGAPFAIDPSHTSRLALGLDRVYETNRRGDPGTWAAISSALDVGHSTTALAYAPGNDNVIYVAYDTGKLFRTTNHGGDGSARNWTEVDQGTSWGSFLTSVVVDPTNSDVAYLTTGYGIYTPAQIWRTLNGGATWLNVTGDLPPVAVNAIVLNHTAGVTNSLLFVGTTVGVFASTGQGLDTHWIRYGSGLPDVSVTSLEFNPTTNLLTAATWGRGVWQIGRSGWMDVPGNGTTDAALNATVFQSKLYLFAKGINDRHTYVNTTADGISWSGQSAVPGNGTTDAALNATAFQGKLYLFAKGINDRRLYVNSTSDGVSWSGQSEVPGGGTTDVTPGAAVFGNRLYLFSKGINDRQVYVNTTMDGSHWSGWSLVATEGTTDVSVDPVVFGNRLYVFSKGINDHQIYVNTTSDGISWNPLGVLPGGGTTDAPLSATVFGNQLTLYRKGINDNRFYVDATTDGRTWSGWSEVPWNGTTDVAPASAVLGNQHYLFGKGINDRRTYVNVASWQVQNFYVRDGVLSVYGDQLADKNDTVTLDVTGSGGVLVDLNGEMVQFDPGAIRGVNVYSGGGTNTIHVLHTAPSVAVSVYGASSGSTTLVGPNAADTWTITGLGSGTLTSPAIAGTLTFSSIQNLLGGAGPNRFLLTDGGGVSGTISGGGINTLDYSASTSTVSVNLPLLSATGVGGGIRNIQNVIGGHDGPVGSYNLLVGNGGNLLTGGNGRRNLLIAGSSSSTLLGGNGDDILIGGTTAYDRDIYSLRAIMASWTGSESYDIRVTRLLMGSGVPRLDSAAVTGNWGGNTLMRGPGRDFSFGDLVLDTWNGNPSTETFIAMQYGAMIVANNANDSGSGSLRQAIRVANAHPDTNILSFHIGSGPQTIALASPLPAITTPITIDGTTQPGYAGVPLIELNGASAGPGAIGLTLQGGNSLVQGLVINRFDGAGIYLQTNGGDIVQGNYLGTDRTGRIALGNGIGVQIAGVQGCLIGTDGDGVNDAAEGNLISGNRGYGVYLNAFAQQNVVAGNTIGTDITGTVALGNSAGVSIEDGSLNRIGTSGGEVDNAAERNLISGNRGGGVGIYSPSSPTGSVQNVVAGNFIGTDGTGTHALGNGGWGVSIYHTGPGNRIGTNGDGVGDDAERNVISANLLYAGIWIGEADQTVVAGNYIGTDATGTRALGNAAMGILVDSSGVLISRNVISGNGRDSSQPGIAINGNDNVVAGNSIGTDWTGTVALGNAGGGVFVNATALNNRIGTLPDHPDPAERNVISGNTGSGIRLGGAGTNNGSVVAGNYIGTDATGTAALGNTEDGVTIEYSGTTLGGPVDGAGNVIAGNGRYGVFLFGRYGPVTGTLVQGNFIGTNAGHAHLGNASDGIAVSGASDNMLGGTVAGAGNVIGYNGRDGVRVEGGTGNAIQGNAIFGHTMGLGIRLLADGNHQQASPVLTSATSGGGATTIQGTLTSTPNSTFTLEFFANTICHPSGFGEGEQFLGSWTVTTDANGQADFTAVLAGEVPEGQFVAATATASNQDTSSFSACVVVMGL